MKWYIIHKTRILEGKKKEQEGWRIMADNFPKLVTDNKQQTKA